MSTLPPCLSAFVSAALALPVAGTPRIGDKAPPVKVSKWINARPAALPGESGADKHVFLVEFWATWCGPCKRSIPHLAKLHRKYEKEGLIIIGVTNEDEEVVQKYLKGRNPSRAAGADARNPATGVDMPYFVALDDDMETNENYMKEIQGIPHAFLIDRNGVVVWTGNPLDEENLDRAIALVLAGKFNVEQAKKDVAAGKKVSQLMNELQAAFASRDEKRVFSLVDQMIEARPGDLQNYFIKRHMLGEFNRVGEIPALDAKMEESMKDSLPDMLQIARFLLDREPGQRNAGLLLRSAMRADELAGKSDPEVIAVLAQVHCQLGMIDAAIVAQKRAMELAPADEKKAYSAVLKYYEDAKDLARSTSGK